MRNFYSIEGKHFFNGKKYIENWVQFLGLTPENIEKDKLLVQRLSSHIHNLWKKFNKERDELDKHYMESGNDIHAYFASFLVSNIERVFSLLLKSENIFALESIFTNELDELIVADFGSGPLSGTVGLLAALEHVFAQKPYLKVPKKIIIYAIERSEKAVNSGAKILTPSLLNGESVLIERVTSILKVTKPIDIILSINVFNEIPEKHRIKTIRSMFNQLKNGGIFLLVEPGQTTHSKKLGSLRDSFIAEAVDCEIVSPCAHKEKCPLSSETNRKDWCWFKHEWNPPQTLLLLDKHSKLDHHVLNYSYLFIQKNKMRSAKPFFARCVSDEFKIDIKNKSLHEYFLNNLSSGEKSDLLELIKPDVDLYKVLLCTNAGNLESTLIASNSDQELFKRGRRIEVEMDVPIRAKERI